MTASPSLEGLLLAQRAAFLRDGPPPLARRLEDLGRLRRAITGRRVAFAQAISADFGHRSRHETDLLDLGTTLEGIAYLRKHLGRWMRPERRGVAVQFRPGTNRIEYQPLGVVGVISPWNYPAALALMPLATALAAGNRVMLKPSEVTSRTSALLAEMLGELFPSEQITVVLGDAAVGAEFSALPFDHLLFTGGTGVGRAILKAATAHLVPVTLELGGKSPAIVDSEAELSVAARRIAFGKLANAGQTCVGADYALVPRDRVDTFVAEFQRAVEKLYPAIGSNPDYSSIVSDRHLARLRDLLADATAKGAHVVELGGAGSSATLTHPRTMLPAIVLGVTPEMRVAREEIFGPILPILPYDTIGEAVDYINARPKPLALYFFGPDNAARRQVLARTSSGGMSINDTLMQYGQDDLPFGGVGESGMGAYHGEEGFKRLSHARAVFEQASFNLADVGRPPFGKWFERTVGLLFR